jgi:TRAP-type C4-dicarboxylate transport system substrate-binding protein
MKALNRVATLSAVLLAVLASSAEAQNVALRWNRWLPAGHHLDKTVFIPWMAKVAQVTEGRVKVEPTTASLGPIFQQYDMAANGIADVVYTAEAWTPGLFPLADITALPFIGTDVEKMSIAYWKVYEQHFKPAKPYARVHVLGLNTYSAYDLYNLKRDIARPDDMKGLKLITTGESRIDLLKSMGFTVLSAGLTQMVEMMSTGVADGVMLPADSVNSFSMTRVLKHRTSFPQGLGSGSGVLLVNERKWNSISAKDRAAIDAISGPVITAQLGASLKGADVQAQENFAKAGLKTLVADDALVAYARQAAAPLEAAWIEKAKQKGVDGAAALKMLREQAR